MSDADTSYASKKSGFDFLDNWGDRKRRIEEDKDRGREGERKRRIGEEKERGREGERKRRRQEEKETGREGDRKRRRQEEKERGSHAWTETIIPITSKAEPAKRPLNFTCVGVRVLLRKYNPEKIRLYTQEGLLNMSAATPVRQSGRHQGKGTSRDEDMGNFKESPSKRPRGRSRSPSRRAKSPSRAKKSPSRTGKSPNRSSRSPPRSTRTAKALEVQTVESSGYETKQTTVSSRRNVTRQSKSPTRQSQRVLDRVEVGGDVVPAETIAFKGPRKADKSFQFGGPLGVSCVMILAPILLLLLNLVCMKGSCRMKSLPPLPKSFLQVFDWQSVIIYTGWIFLQLLLTVVLPGRRLEGQTLATGNRLIYKCNGFLCLLVSMLALTAAMFILKWPVLCVTKKLAPIILTAIVITFLASIILYRSASSVEPTRLAPSATTDSWLYNFFIGRELNPRVGNLDLKMFALLRLGLISWVALNSIYLMRHFKDMGPIPLAPGLIAAFQIFYVCDALWFEETFLTTKATQNDGMGFMMMFGSLAWVPFYFSLPVRYLLIHHRTENNYYMLTAVCLLQVVGYVLYRGSNSQKNIFRRNPFDVRLAHMETIPITSKRILSSGWWGLCRHPNYLGDLLMALSWTIPGGFSLLPMSYLIFLVVMLFYRAKYDDADCLSKYGPSWERYCRRVRFRILPYIY
ncbi:Delta(14)-sterol reductase TM7SF2 [Lamellibrachia satsuma]|nr:Delta(14)-sterol reductase TM7SF2 [Lamellibrachia satsuma]